MSCGCGINAKYLLDKGHEVYGVDGSDEAIRLTQNIAGDIKNINIRFFKYDLWYKLPFENNFFDIVLDIKTIQHHTHSVRKKILKECLRITKNMGTLFSIVRSEYDSRAYEHEARVTQIRTYIYDNLTKIIHYSTKDEIMDLYTRAGYTKLDVWKVERSKNIRNTTSHWIIEARK